MNKKLILLFSLTAFVLLINACARLEPPAPAAETLMNAPVEGLSASQNQLFNAGGEEFDKVYSAETGLGPAFVSTSCASCHAGDNRGHLFTVLTRFGQTDSTGNTFLAMGGPQLQDKAIPGHTPEGLPEGAAASRFVAPIAAGAGFLELVPDADILAMAAANAGNPDGVRGHPNWCSIPSYVTPFANAIPQNGKYICRFGRKASTYNLLQQTVGAFNQDMGITSTLRPENPVNYLETNAPALPADPEVSNTSVNALVFYLQTLQVPIQRNSGDAAVQQGKEIFSSTGCVSCHKESLTTGYSPVPSLSYKTFHPYTDLLLHDMGAGLDDGYTEGSAKTSEWRTTPLWGLGLAKDAQGGNLYLLHDGRAHSIEEAILYHGGEAATSVNRYQQLSPDAKQALIRFLESL